jgi:hypothetical protein
MADLSTALMGIGAAFQGQAPQFLQQQQQRQAQERAQLLQNEQLAEQRKTTMFKDAMMMKANPQMAGSILADRKAQLQRFQDMGVPIDTRHTDEMLALYQSGDMNAFNNYLNNVVQAGISTGVLAAPAAPTAYDPGQMLRMPDGTFKQVPTPEGYVDPEAWKDAKGTIRTDLGKLSKEARDVTTQFSQIEKLADQVANKNNDERTRRTSLATLITILAKTASPGSVTETEFQNFGGAESISAYIQKQAATGGDFQLLRDFISGSLANNPEAASLLASLDPLNPDTFIKENTLNMAKGLILPSGEGILGQFADYYNQALPYNPQQSDMKSLFGPRQTITQVGKLLYGDSFDAESFYKNPVQALDSFRATLSQQAAQQIIPQAEAPSQPGQVYNYETIESAMRAASSGVPVESIRVFNPQTQTYEEVEPDA